jgi:hypothetical protein
MRSDATAVAITERPRAMAHLNRNRLPWEGCKCTADAETCDLAGEGVGSGLGGGAIEVIGAEIEMASPIAQPVIN